MRITCIINSTTEMEDYMGYELAKHPPSLFDKGVIRRTAKSALGALRKSKVDVHARLHQHCKCVLDGGHLLHVVRGQLQPHTSTCARPMSPTQCNTTEVNRLLCSMAMTALRQPAKLNNNDTPLNPYLLTLCLSPT